MRLSKRRLIMLGTGLLAITLSLLGLAIPHVTAKASTSTNMLVTLYGWPDNSPPGNDIAYPANGGFPTIHSVASGTGTFSDPITYATDKSELPIGTIVYYPFLHRYFIMEDDCVECDQDWTGHGPDGGPNLWHIDLWIGGQNGNSTDVINCEDALTQNSEQVIVNPPSNEPVDTTPLFNSSGNQCYDPSSFHGGGGGGSGTITENNSSLCLSTAGESSALKTDAIIGNCDGSSAQSWTVNSNGTISNGAGLCLSIAGGATAATSLADVYTCNGSAPESWTVNSDGTITNDNSGLCLSIRHGTTTAGSDADIYTCNGSASEFWTVNLA